MMRSFDEALVFSLPIQHVCRLLLLAAALSGTISASAADRDSELIRRENATSGARDWQLTRVALVNNTSVRAAYIEGYCTKQSVCAGESLGICVSTNPPTSFLIEIFRTGFYGGRGARLMITLGPLTERRSQIPKLAPKICTNVVGSQPLLYRFLPTGPVESIWAV